MEAVTIVLIANLLEVEQSQEPIDTKFFKIR
jgi:hypothetical protein